MDNPQLRIFIKRLYDLADKYQPCPDGFAYHEAAYNLRKAASTLEALSYSMLSNLMAKIRTDQGVDENGDPALDALPAPGWETGYAAGIRSIYLLLKESLPTEEQKD